MGTPGPSRRRWFSETYFTAADGVRSTTPTGLRANVPPERLKQIALCVIVLNNGHAAVGVNEGPVSPENFDAEMARGIAREKAIDQIWPVLS